MTFICFIRNQWLANIVFICGTSFAPFIAYLRSPSSFELDCPCLSRISKGSSPDADWRDLVLLQSMSWWWVLETDSSWLGWAVEYYYSVSRQNWNINITSLNMFVFISFDWWKVTSQVFFFFSNFRWLLSISFILPRRKMREIFIIFCTLIHHLY